MEDPQAVGFFLEAAPPQGQIIFKTSRNFLSLQKSSGSHTALQRLQFIASGSHTAL